MYVDKKKKKNHPWILNKARRQETVGVRGAGVENVFPGSFKYMQIAVQPI